MRKKLIIALLVGAIISITHSLPVRGAEIMTIRPVLSCAEEEQYIKSIIRTRYTIDSLNVRKKPGTKYKIIKTLRYNKKIYIKYYNDDWVELVKKSGKHIGYVGKRYLSKKPMPSKTYHVPEYGGMKSWMDYRKITAVGSPQWILQHEYAYTGSYGIRVIDGRYCIAIGSAFPHEYGDYIDLKLENGTVIPCVSSDSKDDSDTDGDNIFTVDTQCCTEFIVDADNLNQDAAIWGDVSKADKRWSSPVIKIRIYQKNVLNQ